MTSKAKLLAKEEVSQPEEEEEVSHHQSSASPLPSHSSNKSQSHQPASHDAS